LDTGESTLRDREIPFEKRSLSRASGSKGNRVKIPEPEEGIGLPLLDVWLSKAVRLRAAGGSSGNATQLGEGGKGPGKSSLFFLTVERAVFMCLHGCRQPFVRIPGIDLLGDRGSVAGKAAHYFECCPVHS